jgi:hypothetical protein
MTARRHDDLSAVEQRLARRQPQAVPPGMRGRVLAAIDDALAGQRASPRHGAVHSGVGGIAAACGALALTFVLLVLLTGDRPARGSPAGRRLPSLADRAAAAGVVLDAYRMEKTLAAVPRRRDRSIDAATVLRPIDVTRFLEGDL